MSENKIVNRVFAAVLIGLLLFFIYRYLPFESNVNPTELVFSDEAGKQMKLFEKSDKPMLIHFYASWCGPCMAEFPEIVSAYASWSGSHHLTVLTDDSWKEIKKTQAKFNPGFPIYKLDGSLKTAGIYSIPATLETDKNGKVIRLHSGRWNWREY